MTLSTYQFSFNGLTFGAGTPYVVTEISGLAGMPDFRVQDDNRGWLDGMFTGRDFLGPRHFIINTLTLAGGGYTAQQNFETLRKALMYSQTKNEMHDLVFAIPPYTEQQITCRVRDHKTMIDPEFTYGFIRSQWTFYAPDPRLYSTTLQSSSLSATVVNGGAVQTPLIITIGSASAGSSISDGTNTMTFSLDPSGVTINTYDRTILSSSGLSVRNVLDTSSTWITDAAVGSTTLTGSGLSATVQWRDAYL